LNQDPPEQLSPERRRQALGIVADALDEKSPERRAALVAKRCDGDLLLRREVESLLEQTTGLFEQAAEEASGSRDTPALESGRRLGAYAVIREVGRGGMGAVYLARRADGAFEKQVAIKVLKRGLDTDEILRRFLTERQILARLDHPAIVRVLDAGTTEDGLPFLVMDHVEAVPISQFVRKHQLSVPERLKLFRVVCSAVTYAHQNLIVHRDLKPSNILVTASGDVRLLDFGIAKLLEPDSEGRTVTITMLRVMTPEYASPEQIKGEAITTVSDVYSLGVVLYELLTGERPYKLTRTTPDELNKAICEQEPERPSTAIARSDRNSRFEIRDSKILRGDLDNIVLKALRKDPSRRYGSVAELSDDIRRQLEGLPVRARSDTFSYRAGKFVQRHKLGVAAAAVILFALVGGVIAASWEARRARRAEKNAEKRFAQVRALAHSVLFDYHDAIANLSGSTAVREKLVKDSLQYLDGLAQEGTSDRSLQWEIASAYLKVGDVQGGPYRANLGDTESASVSYRKACDILEKLYAADPADRQTQKDLAKAYEKLGGIQLRKGLWDESLHTQEKSVATAEKLVAADPKNPKYLDVLAQAYLRYGYSSCLGKNSLSVPAQLRALEKFQQARAIAESLSAGDPGNADLCEQVAIYTAYVSYAQAAIGRLSGDRKSTESSVQSLQRSYDIYESIATADPLNTSARRNAALSLAELVRPKLELQEIIAARADAEQSLARIRELASADPANREAQGDLANVETTCATAMQRAGDNAGALGHTLAAIEIYEVLLKADPASVELKEQVASTYDLLADVHARRGNTLDALKAQGHALGILESCASASGSSTDLLQSIGTEHEKIGGLYETLAGIAQTSAEERQANWRSARSEYQAALDSWQRAEKNGAPGLPKTKRDEVVAALAKCDTALR
jgi:eukaryotic-like serine/threonine-protein kinase